MMDWEFWLRLRQMKLWQAVALTLNVDPFTLKNGTIDDLAKRKAFDRAILLAVDATDYADGPIWAARPTFGKDKRMCDVKLADVAAYAVACDWWSDIPDEIRRLAQAALVVPPKPPDKPVEAAPVMPRTPTDNPVVAVGALEDVEPDKSLREDRGFVYKKKVLIEKLISIWPSIQNDFQHGNANGLIAAARAGRGEYWESAALAWARKNGKVPFTEQTSAPVNSVFNLTGTKYTAL